MACHFPAVSVVPVVSASPLKNGIPCGRPVHWKAAFLAGDQHPTKLPLITSKNYEIILSKDLEKLYAHYQTCIGIAQLP